MKFRFSDRFFLEILQSQYNISFDSTFVGTSTLNCRNVKIMVCKKNLEVTPLDTERKLKVHETFRRRCRCHLNVLWTSIYMLCPGRTAAAKYY